MVVSLLIYHAQICVCVKVVRTQTKLPILILFDEDVYDSNDEYSEDGFDSDEEENGGKLFSDDEGKP